MAGGAQSSVCGSVYLLPAVLVGIWVIGGASDADLHHAAAVQQPFLRTAPERAPVVDPLPQGRVPGVRVSIHVHQPHGTVPARDTAATLVLSRARWPCQQQGQQTWSLAEAPSQVLPLHLQIRNLLCRQGLQDWVCYGVISTCKKTQGRGEIRYRSCSVLITFSPKYFFPSLHLSCTYSFRASLPKEN